MSNVVVLTRPRSGSSLFCAGLQSALGGVSGSWLAGEWYLFVDEVLGLDVGGGGGVGGGVVKFDFIETTAPEVSRVSGSGGVVSSDFDLVGRRGAFADFVGPELDALLGCSDVVKAFQDWHFKRGLVFRVFADLIYHDFQYWEFLKFCSDVRLVYLYRENVLDRLVSNRLAHEFNVWHSYVDLGLRRVVVDLKVLGDWLASDEYLHWYVVSNFPNRFSVSYAELSEDFEGVMGRVCDFCGLERSFSHPGLRRINRFSKRDVIVNFGEVEGFLRGTKWSWMLND